MEVNLENLSVTKRVLCFFSMMVCTGFLSSRISWANSSWSQQPSWVTDSSSLSRKSALSQDSRNNISPFSPASNNIALDLGQIFLMGDLGNNYSDNIGARLHYTYGVSELFGFDSSLGYSEHSDGKFSMTTLLAGLRTNLSWYDKIVPYFIGGLGFYWPNYRQLYSHTPSGTTVLTPSTSLAPVLFGVHLGPGIDLELTQQLFFGAAITFHDVFGATKIQPNGTPIEVGGTYTSFFLRTGVTF